MHAKWAVFNTPLSFLTIQCGNWFFMFGYLNEVNGVIITYSGVQCLLAAVGLFLMIIRHSGERNMVKKNTSVTTFVCLFFTMFFRSTHNFSSLG